MQIFDEESDTQWVARGGSTIHYGSIDAERDFFDPDGNPLFDEDEEPDDEHYEGYTGNAGGELGSVEGPTRCLPLRQEPTALTIQ